MPWCQPDRSHPRHDGVGGPGQYRPQGLQEHRLEARAPPHRAVLSRRAPPRTRPGRSPAAARRRGRVRRPAESPVRPGLRAYRMAAAHARSRNRTSLQSIFRCSNCRIGPPASRPLRYSDSSGIDGSATRDCTRRCTCRSSIWRSTAEARSGWSSFSRRNSAISRGSARWGCWGLRRSRGILAELHESGAVPSAAVSLSRSNGPHAS